MTPAEEVKAKLDIVEIIQEYIPLKKRGASHFACCPFHQEKTPSFHVSQDRQFYKCFGCGEGGDVFAFVQKMEGMDFPEVLRHLAEKAGVKIERFDAGIQSQKNRILDLLDLAARFYHEALIRSEAAEEARAYLKKRALTDTTVELFRLGFAPNTWDTLLNFLISKKYSSKEAFEAGLAVRRDRGDGYYDRFRGRIMFTIRDLHGRVVGFTARILPSEENNPQAGGKYINTPQTDFYNKSRILYGLDLAKQSIKSENMAVIVEGNMDVISSFQAGVKNVVASSGTALGEEQIALIRRFTENVSLSFDMDKAGETAAEKGIGLALQSGLNARVITLPNGAGKDPDDAIRKNPEIWRTAISQAKPVMEYLIGVGERRFGLGDGIARKQFAKMLVPYIAKINDKIEQNYWFGKLSTVLTVPVGILREYITAPKATRSMEASPKAAIEPSNRYSLVAKRLLSLLLLSPENADFIIDRVTPVMLLEPQVKHLYEQTIVHYNSTGTLKYADFKQKLADSADFKLVDLLDRLIVYGEAELGSFEDGDRQKEVLSAVKDLRECFAAEERKRLTRELAMAESRGDNNLITELSYKIQELLKIGEHLTHEN